MIILTAVIISWKKLLYGFYLFVFSLPFVFIPKIFGMNFTLPEIIIFILLMIFCLKNFKELEIRLKRTKFDLPILLFLFITIIAYLRPLLSLNFQLELSNLSTSSPIFILRILLATFSFGLIYFLAINIIKKENIKKTIFILLFTSSIAALYGICQFLFLDTVRIMSFFDHPNFFGMFLGMIIPVSLVFFLKNKNKKIFWIFPLILFLALIFTFSRGGLVGALFGLIFFLFFLKIYNKGIKKQIIIIFILLILSFMIFFFIEKIEKNESSFLKERISQTKEEGLGIRYYYWKETLEKIKENPILGKGYLLLNDGTEHAHNIYLQLWMERGIFCLLIFFLILFLLFKDIKIYSSYSLAIIAGIFAFTVHGLVDYVLKIGFLLFLYLAIISKDS